MAQQKYTKGDRFTVKHNATSKEKIEYLKDILGVHNQSQIVHMALQQYYKAVKYEEEAKRARA